MVEASHHGPVLRNLCSLFRPATGMERIDTAEGRSLSSPIFENLDTQAEYVPPLLSLRSPSASGCWISSAPRHAFHLCASASLCKPSKLIPYLLPIPAETEISHGVLTARVVAASEKQFRSAIPRVQPSGTSFETVTTIYAPTEYERPYFQARLRSVLEFAGHYNFCSYDIRY